MREQETQILTHYTEVAEARHRDVRRMQAEVARTLFRATANGLVHRLNGVKLRGRVPGFGRA